MRSRPAAATCHATGTSNSTYSTQWTAGHTQDSSSGSTNSFSNELSMSYSEGAGVTGVDAANFGMDVAASTSLNTLNESSTSMSTFKAISVHTPQFGYASMCCDCAFGGYVVGLKNIKNPASEVCQPPVDYPMRGERTSAAIIAFVNEA
ncbi:MAG: hypothetical protein ABI380_11450 [Edaphobacter sp.]